MDSTTGDQIDQVTSSYLLEYDYQSLFILHLPYPMRESEP